MYRHPLNKKMKIIDKQINLTKEELQTLEAVSTLIYEMRDAFGDIDWDSLDLTSIRLSTTVTADDIANALLCVAKIYNDLDEETKKYRRT